MQTSESTEEITKALSKLQSKLGTVSKDITAYKYKYADLASIWDSFRPFLEELGLFIFQDVKDHENGISVSTRIMHISGQWIQSDYFTIPVAKKDAHSTGSACTYGKRYSITAVLGITTGEQDDDGNAAQKAAPKEERPKANENDIMFFKEVYDSPYLNEYITKYRTHEKLTEAELIYRFMQNEQKFKEHYNDFCKKKEEEKDE